jgi:hypothetical protein
MIDIHVADAGAAAGDISHVRANIPLPKGFLPTSSRIVVIDPAGRQLPDQQSPLARWSDGSTKWLQVDFLAIAESSAYESFQLRPASEADAVESGPDLVRTTKGEFKIETGGLHVRVPDRGADLFVCGRSPDFTQPTSRARLALTDDKGVQYFAETQSVSVDENGPLRATICLKAQFSSDGDSVPVIVTTKLTFYSRTSMISAEVDIWNPRAAAHPGNLWDLGDNGSCNFQDFSLELEQDTVTREVTWQAAPTHDRQSTGVLPWSIYQDSSGGENWNSRNHVDANGESTVNFRGFEVRSGEGAAILESGFRSEPLVCLETDAGWTKATVRDFWQNFPKAIRCRSDGLSIGLFPAECGRSFELQGGERKRHAVLFESGILDAPSEPPRMIRPLEASIDPKWVQQCAAVPYLKARSGGDDATYDHYMASIIEGPAAFVNRREVIDEFGWRNFGELYADHESAGQPDSSPRISHYNNQYDFVFAAAVHYLRSGDVRWRGLMEDAARHHIDIDIYHTDQDRPAYNGGLFWHTDHYMDAATATHRTYSRQNALGKDYGGGPSNEHNYTSGLLLYYFLSGDNTARSAVLRLADWVLSMDDGHDTILSVFCTNDTGKASATVDPNYHKPGRGAGNSINALIDAYTLSGDRKYMTKAEALVLRCIHPNDDIESLDLDEPELRWSYLVFLQVLGKYLATKHELGETDYYFYYARDSLLHYVRWMSENEVPYNDVLDKVELPTESWPAQDIRKCHVFHLAALCAQGERRQAFLERAGFFYQRCLDDLLSFETAHLTRPRVILAAYGYVHTYFRDVRTEDSPKAYLAEHCYNFGEPAVFRPQHSLIKDAIRHKRSIVARELGRVIRAKVAAFSGFLNRRGNRPQ